MKTILITEQSAHGPAFKARVQQALDNGYKLVGGAFIVTTLAVEWVGQFVTR